MEIDDKLKNRLAGAAVVTVLAVIFLPMLFDEPVEKKPQIISELALPQKPEPSPLLETAILPDSTLDVTQKAPPKSATPSSVTPAAVKTPAKTPSTINGLSEEENNLDIAIPVVPKNNPVPPVAAVEKTKPVVPEATPPATTQPTPGQRQWVIQVASLTDEGKAKALQEKLRGQGFSASIQAVMIKGKQFYRLKVGPELDAARAEATKTKINQLNNVHSITQSE
jgi:DedD protein